MLVENFGEYYDHELICKILGFEHGLFHTYKPYAPTSLYDLCLHGS
jgi:hypothetical protein